MLNPAVDLQGGRTGSLPSVAEVIEFKPGEPLVERVFPIDKLSVGAAHDFLLVTDRGSWAWARNTADISFLTRSSRYTAVAPDAWLVFARWQL